MPTPTPAAAQTRPPMVPLAEAPGTPLRLESFILGIGLRAAPADLGGLQVGSRLLLRPAERLVNGSRVEVVTPEGQPLGWLPPEDAEALAAAGIAPEHAAVHVIGLLPGFGRPRIQLGIAEARER